MTQVATLQQQQTGLVAQVQQGGAGTMEIATSRSAQEIQAAMIMAMHHPRNQIQSYNRIMEACKRPRLAAEATYSYPRGGTKVEGPSIRLAEVLAQNWGNIDFGMIELERTENQSSIMAYAWDLETNTRQTKVFQVDHVRYSRAKGRAKLEDPRDVYEVVANQGARRIRSCILGIIPGDIVDAALEECEKTLLGSKDVPLKDRIRSMVAKFSEVGVDQKQIEARLGHNIEATSIQEVVGLQKIYRSIADGMSKPAEWFEVSLETTVDEIRKAHQEQPEKAQAPEEPRPQEEPLADKKSIQELSFWLDDMELSRSNELLKSVGHLGEFGTLTQPQASKLLEIKSADENKQ